MTEAMFLLSFCGTLWAVSRYLLAPSVFSATLAGLFLVVGEATRYDAWVLAAGVGLVILATGGKARVGHFAWFSLLVSLVPLWWLAHNWWFYGDALEFYRGPYSPKAIAERTSAGGTVMYPGHKDILQAVWHLLEAVRLYAGTVLAALGLVGIFAVLWKRQWWLLLLLLGVPCFYVLSIYNGTVPVFIPTISPFSYYNSRYAVIAMPLLCVAVAALLALVGDRSRALVGMLLVLAALAQWVLYPSPQTWVVWKESDVNSVARRAWSQQTAQFLQQHYRPGQGVLSTMGDVGGVYPRAGIAFREVLHDGNNPQYMAALRRPDLFLQETWIVALQDDEVDRVARADSRYRLVKVVTVPGAPPVNIYRR